MGVFITMRCDRCGSTINAYVSAAKAVRVANGFNHVHDPGCNEWEVQTTDGGEAEEGAAAPEAGEAGQLH